MNTTNMLMPEKVELDEASYSTWSYPGEFIPPGVVVFHSGSSYYRDSGGKNVS